MLSFCGPWTFDWSNWIAFVGPLGFMLVNPLSDGSTNKLGEITKAFRIRGAPGSLRKWSWKGDLDDLKSRRYRFGLLLNLLPAFS